MAKTTIMVRSAVDTGLAPESIHCVVTSPPYFGQRVYEGPDIVWEGDTECDHHWGGTKNIYLRGYGEESSTLSGGKHKGRLVEIPTGKSCTKCGAWLGKLGNELDPEKYIEHLLLIFAEIKRVLHPSGVVWVVISDKYAEQGKTKYFPKHLGIKAKDLIGIPWMLAFALRKSGWYLRTEAIWNKTNCKPDSVMDRPVYSHEQIFLLSKSRRYFYDTLAVLEPYTNKLDRWGGNDLVAKGRSEWDAGTGQNTYRDRSIRPNPDGRRRRSVWSIPTSPYTGPHYAAFPEDLVGVCIKAGTSEAGCCPKCLSPWRRITRKAGKKKVRYSSTDNSPTGRDRSEADILETVGWIATCKCGTPEPVPCTVLDPFLGTGTTLIASRLLGRDGIGIEISQEYADLAKERLGLDKLQAWEEGAAHVSEDKPMAVDARQISLDI